MTALFILKRLFLAGIAVAMGLTSVVSPAQPQAPPASAKPQSPDPLAALNLTAQQQTQIQQAVKLHQSQIMGILTPDQVNQLKTMSQQNTNPQQIMATLKLSADQQTKLQNANRVFEQQLLAILTPEQQQRLMQVLQQQQGR